MSNSDPAERDAGPSFRGDLYQLDRTVAQWLRPLPGESLVCEGLEDIEYLGAIRVAEQVKHRAEPITLRKSYLLESVAWFVKAWLDHGDSYYFRYFTNAEAAKERGWHFPGGGSGVQTWQSIADGSLPDAAATIACESIQKLFREATAAPAGNDTRSPIMRSFHSQLSNLSTDQFKKFIRHVEISTGNPGSSAAETEVSQLIESKYQLDRVNATTLGLTLSAHVLRMLALERSARPVLNRGELQRIADEYLARRRLTDEDARILKDYERQVGPRAESLIRGAPAAAGVTKLLAHVTKSTPRRRPGLLREVANRYNRAHFARHSARTELVLWKALLINGEREQPFDEAVARLRRDLDEGELDDLYQTLVVAEDALFGPNKRGVRQGPMSDGGFAVRHPRFVALQAIAHWLEERDGAFNSLQQAAEMLLKSGDSWTAWAWRWVGELALATHDVARLVDIAATLRTVAQSSVGTDRTRLLLCAAEVGVNSDWTDLLEDARMGKPSEPWAAVVYARRGRTLAWEGNPRAAEKMFLRACLPAQVSGLLGERREAVHSVRQLRQLFGPHIDEDTAEALTARAVGLGRGFVLRPHEGDYTQLLYEFTEDWTQNDGGKFRVLRGLRHLLWAVTTSGHFGFELNLNSLLAEYHLRANPQLVNIGTVLEMARRYAITAGDGPRAVRAATSLHQVGANANPKEMLSHLEDPSPWTVGAGLKVLACESEGLTDIDVHQCFPRVLSLLQGMQQPESIVGLPARSQVAVDASALCFLAAVSARLNETEADTLLNNLPVQAGIVGSRDTAECLVHLLMSRIEVGQNDGSRALERLRQYSKEAPYWLKVLATNTFRSFEEEHTTKSGT